LELSKFVGSKIREYRKNKNMTQKELGEKIGVKHNTISDYEKGKISPEQDMLFALAGALEVSINDFFPALDDNNDLEDALIESNDNLDLSDMAFLKEMINQLESLEGDDRERFMDNIRLAVEFYNKSGK